MLVAVVLPVALFCLSAFIRSLQRRVYFCFMVTLVVQKRVLSSASSRPHLLVYSFIYISTYTPKYLLSPSLFSLSLFFPLRHFYLLSAQHTVSSASSLYLASSITTPSFRSSPSCVYVCVCSPRLTLVLTPSSLFCLSCASQTNPSVGRRARLESAGGQRAEGDPPPSGSLSPGLLCIYVFLVYALHSLLMYVTLFLPTFL